MLEPVAARRPEETSAETKGKAPLSLSLSGISKEFELPTGPLLVLEDISFDVSAGEFIAIVGPSGSGKSTLLRIIAGLIPPSAGRVIYNGRPQTGVNLDCAMVFQSFALLPWLTVQENVELGLDARGLSPVVRCKNCLLYTSPSPRD